MAPISQHKAQVFKPVDLLVTLMQAGGLSEGVAVSPAIWQGSRHPSQAQRGLIDQRLQASGGGPRIAILLLDLEADRVALERTTTSLDAINLYRNVNVVELRASRISDAGLWTRSTKPSPITMLTGSCWSRPGHSSPPVAC
ncbi:hypothetical protein A6R73_07435 [Xanthomonas translucens pv. poae]|uniref:Uncharacterized protein n=1 Tax=Xanthomonas graminis pv. poae TaxID=227946 RepID=A0A199NWK4_9XANT|nr:hypothetical protein A6R73_07435 [Xanthomonas translucens pv. poae]